MSTKEDRIAFLEKAIESTKANWKSVKEGKELEVEFEAFLSKVTQKVTEQAKEFYDKGYAAGYSRGMNFALTDEYMELTGKVYGHEPPSCSSSS